MRYAIDVYNNGIYNEEVDIIDFLPDKGTHYSWHDSANETISASEQYSKGKETHKIISLSSPYSRDYKNFKMSEGNTFKTIYIDIKYGAYSGNDNKYEESTDKDYDLVYHDKNVNQVIYTADANEASVYSTTYGNDSNCRTADADFIKMKSYKADISKSVNRIKNGGSWRTPNDAEKSGYSVESGDIVEYAIAITNYADPGEDQSSRSGDISIAYVNDTFTHENGYKLNYINCQENQDDSINSTGDPNTSSVTLELKNIPNNSTKVFYAYFYVDIDKEYTKESRTFVNTVSMNENSIVNKNGVTVKNIYGDRSSSVSVKSKIYKISLEKFVEEEKDKALTNDNCDITNRNGIPEYNYGKKKYNDPVLTSQGSKIKYIIKLNNNGSRTKGAIDNTTLSCSKIKDIRWPESSINGDSEGGYVEKIFTETVTDDPKNMKERYISPGSEQRYNYARVIQESNVSDKTLSNTAEMIEWFNKNGKEVLDSTTDDNKDADYIKMKPNIANNVEITAKKEWIGNKALVNEVKATLYANGKVKETVSLNSGNGWRHTWTNLPYKNKNDGKNVAIKYEVKEETTSDAYTSDVKKTTKYIRQTNNDLTEHYTYTLVNKPNKQDNVAVQKVWLDDETTHPDITVKLVRVANNQKEDVKTITLSDNNWYYEWTNLPKDDGKGNAYTYSVEEINAPVINNVKYRTKYEVNDNTTIIYNIPDTDKPYTISGTVWNDKAVDKTNTYNSIIDDYEYGIENIKVNLYRVENGKATKVANTTTDASGYYCFRDEDIYQSIPVKQRYIKGPIDENSNRWKAEDGDKRGEENAGKYFYTYYIEYQYNGITYTSTPDGKTSKEVSDTENYKINQNAKETENSRETVNNNFANINNGSGIEYTTSNKNGYLPESDYVFDEKTMSAISTVDQFKVSKNIEPQMQYINLGLRGKNVFDLELQSDVYKTEVKVNGQNGFYDYADGKLFLRKDKRDSVYTRYEDDANKYQSGMTSKGEEYNQNIKKTDVDTEACNQTEFPNIDEKYINNKTTDLQFFITYKISINNASNTKGMATEITSYIDNNYEFVKAVDEEQKELTVSGEGEKDNYKYTKIKTITDSFNEKYNKSANKNMYIYVTYELKIGDSIAAKILKESQKIQTRCMTEISAYTTFGTSSVDSYEHCKGLIDKDSAPGSANIETVRTIDSEGVNTATKGGNPTTVEYYFNRNSELRKLKYEDDTDTSILVTEVVDSIRTLDGKAFEDYTSFKNEENVDESEEYYGTNRYNSEKVIKVKTGNGIKENDEPGVKGIIVELMEEVSADKFNNNDNANYQKTNDNGIEEASDSKYYKLVTQTITDENGDFKFESYLPGNYIVRYWYGEGDIDSEKNSAVYSYISKTGEGKKLEPNNKSYNGEDFQATNNIGKYGAKKLSTEKNYWYAFNETDKFSTAKDIDERRKIVSKNVTGFDENKIILLNSMRDGTIKEKDLRENQEILSDTKMNAVTPLMQLRVEETVDVNILKNTEKDDNNNINVRTDDLGREYIVVDANTNRERSLEVIEKDEDGIPKLSTWMEFPSADTQYTEYHISEVNLGISETPVTTVDLQKHVKSLRITDSANENIIAEAEIDLSTTQVIVYPKKISATQVDTVVDIIKRVFDKNDSEATEIKRKINNIRTNPLNQSSIKLLKEGGTNDSNYLIDIGTNGITEDQRIQLENLIINKSCAGIFEFKYNWNVKAGKVVAEVGTNKIPIEVDDEKLQGARIEITYKVTASIFAEKSFNNDAVLVPTIKNLVDFVDNDLSYNENLIANGDKLNSYYWRVISREDVDRIFDENGFEKGRGTIDISTEKNKYSTLLVANNVENGLLLDKLGRGEAYITLEKELSSNELTWGNVIENNIDTYEYDNHIEIVSFDYKNTTESQTNDFIFRDRVRRPNRYTILAGTQYDSAKAETVSIIPPLGKDRSIAKYIIIASVGIILIGATIIIKKKKRL